MFAQGMQDDCAAHGKTAHGEERHHLGERWAQPELIGKKGSRSEENPENVEPDRRPDGLGVLLVVKANLQQQRSQADGRHNHHGQGAEESAPLGEDNDQAEEQAKDGRGDYRPATVLYRFVQVGHSDARPLYSTGSFRREFFPAGGES